MYRKWEVPSETTPGKNYIVRMTKKGLRCSCPQGVFKGSCKHIDQVKQFVEWANT